MMLLTENKTEDRSIRPGPAVKLHEGTGDGGAERRRGLRIRQARPIKIFEPTTHRYFGGRTEDISSTGLRIELPLSVPVRPGKMLNVHVGLNDHGEALANRRSMMAARVVWVNRSYDLRGKLIAGIELIPSVAAHLDAA